MNVKTVLYYRYLMRQSFIVNIVLILILSTITFLLFFTPILDRLTSIIIVSIVWVFALYGLCVSFVWLYKFIKCKKSLKNLDLYNHITNAAIRNKVVQSRIKIKCLFTTQTQAQNFFNTIEPEIEKQKKLISLKKHEN